jgi:hypothetical protein
MKKTGPDGRDPAATASQPFAVGAMVSQISRIHPPRKLSLHVVHARQMHGCSQVNLSGESLPTTKNVVFGLTIGINWQEDYRLKSKTPNESGKRDGEVV